MGYKQKSVKTYEEIERERLKLKKYVIYDFFEKPDPDLPDEYNVDGVWCKYFVNAPKGGAGRVDTIIMRLTQYDYHNNGNGNKEFREIEKLLKDNGYAATDYFKRFCTVNIKGDETCRLMLIAGARIDFKALKKDLAEALRGKGKYSVSDILHILAGQANAAALGGAFTKFFSTIYSFENADAPLKKYDDMITDFYKKTVKGGGKIKNPIEIPTAPNIRFDAPHYLYNSMKELEKADKVDDLDNTVAEELQKIIVVRLNAEKKF